MHDLHHMRAIARHYCHLQGLRVVPWGILMLVMGVWEALDLFGYGGFADGGPSLVFMLLGLGACLALDRVLSRYYRRTFGSVRRSLADWLREFVALGIFLGGWVAAVYVEAVARPPISAVGLTFAGALAFYWWVTGRIRPQYLAMAVVFLGLSFVPLLGPSYHVFLPGEASSARLWLLLGLVFVIGGIGDHRLLAHSLAPTLEEDHVHADAV